MGLDNVSDKLSSLQIETTNACNLRCPMCSREVYLSGADFKEGFMSFELFKKIVDEAAALGVSSLKLTWRGEPTLHEKLVEFVKYAKASGINNVSFSTNALLLNEQLSKSLIGAGLDKIIFSLDSANEETYAKIRVGSDFKTVSENIKALKRLKEEIGAQKPVTVASMIKTKFNYSEEQLFKDYYSQITDKVHINRCIEFDGANINAGRNNESFRCIGIGRGFLIDWDGTAIPCGFDGAESYILGNANSDSLYDLWNCEKLVRIRKLHAENRFYEIDICRACSMATNMEN